MKLLNLEILELKTVLILDQTDVLSSSSSAFNTGTL